MTMEEFVRHVIKQHGFGMSGGADAGTILSLTSEATRGYHRHLHETRDDLDHEHEELL